MTDLERPRGMHAARCPTCGRRRIVRWFTAEKRLVYRRHGCDMDNRPIPAGTRVERIN